VTSTGVNFINMLLCQAFKLTNALALKFYFINNYTPNFCRSRFHQHFTWAFCAHILGQKITKLCFGFEIFWCKNIGKKSARKMLMKLTPIHLTWSYFYDLHFTPRTRKICINLLAQKLFIEWWCIWHQGSISPTFYSKFLQAQIPKAQKKTSCQYLFALWISERVEKLNINMLMKSTLERFVLNVWRALDDNGLLRGLEDDRVVVVLRVEVVRARCWTNHLQQDLAELLILMKSISTKVTKKLDHLTCKENIITN